MPWPQDSGCRLDKRTENGDTGGLNQTRPEQAFDKLCITVVGGSALVIRKTVIKTVISIYKGELAEW